MTNSNQDIYLTKEGLGSLEKELRELEEVKRPKLVKRVAAARTMGDLAENAEYTSARQDLGIVDGRLEELKIILSKAKVIRKSGGKGRKKVGLGCKVTVKIGREIYVYEVVGEWEADPVNKKISHSSPLGKALLGKKAGEEVEIDAPAGKIIYQIQKIH